MAGGLHAAPYPAEGLETEWTQPDGTRLKLRVYGDEFYARTTTEDGYTVVFDEETGAYSYAKAGGAGGRLTSTRTLAHRRPPAGLAKHLKDPAAVVSQVREKNFRQYAGEREAKWSARVRGVRLKREAMAAGITPSADPAAAPVSGGKVGLTILVQFPDDPATGAADPVSFPVTQAKIERYCNQTGYVEDGNTGSVRDYFHDQSNGAISFTQVVTQVVTLPHPRSYYNFSDYPTNLTVRSDSGTAGRMMVTDAINKLKLDGFDFSTLTLDGSGRVVSTSLLFAGNDSGRWAKGLWPHAWSLSSPLSLGSGRSVYRYQVTNLANTAPVIGTFIHELGHLLLDFPDLYDTDASDGNSEGVGHHCLMGAGNHLNSGKTPAPIDLYLKDTLGWANITDITPTQSLDVTLPATGNRGYRIRKPGTATEYFLIENRGGTDKWAASCPDKGIAIWHIDEAVTTDNQRQQMTPSQHYLVSIEQADGAFDLEYGQDRGDSADFFDSSDGLFNNDTNPDADWWGGSPSGISISVLSAPSASMNVRFGVGGGAATLGVSPTSQNVSAAGGSQSFSVTSNVTWSWSDDAAWITSSEAASQSGDQTFSYTVAANTSAASRTGTITFTGGSLTRTFQVVQAGASADDHGNGTANATVVALTSSTAGSIESAGDEDYFRFNVSGSGTLVVESSGSTDTYGFFLDASGNVLASDDDNGVDRNFRVSQVVNTGTYYVRVRHYDSSQTGAYQLVSSFTGTPVLTVLPSSQSVVAAGASHSFSVTSNTGWSWTSNVAWITSGELASQSGDQTFTYSVDANTGTSARSGTITLSGGGLTRTHTVNQAAGSADDHGNSIGAATVVGINSTTAGNLETAGDNDYFRVNVAGSGSFVVESTGSTDTYGYLLDSAGNQLASNDDTVGTNFRITYAVTAGTYYVRVRHYSSTGTGNYQLVTAFTGAAVLSVTPVGSDVAAAAGSFSFNVNSNTTWSWSSNQSWLTAAGESTSQNGNQVFGFAVAANSGAARSGTITFTAGSLTATHTVNQAASALADLRDPGTYYSVSPTSVVPGGTIGVYADVVNSGTAATGAYVVRFYLSSNTTISSSDYLLGEKAMSPLAAGASGIIDAEDLPVPAAIPAGTYYAGWIYDADGVVAESDETNNTGYVTDRTVTVSGSMVTVIEQSLGDGTGSAWQATGSVLAEAELTTANGTSGDAFDGVGELTTTPALVLPPLGASDADGPLTSTVSSGGLTMSRTVRLVAGRHATDEEISISNTGGTSQNFSLVVRDDYGSDSSTQVHGTSSGDTVVTTADQWFVISDEPGAADLSGDPSIMVSWTWSAGMPSPSFSAVPASGADKFTMNFGSFAIGAGQTLKLTIRRELFDSASLALLNGLPVGRLDIIRQSLGDGSWSEWGDLYDTNPTVLADAQLSTANGLSGDAFDGVGVRTMSPLVVLPSLSAASNAGPLTASGTLGNLSVSRTVSLVAGRHATDEVIVFSNTGGAAESISLMIEDDYGADGSTSVHGSSSGDTAVSAADNWFVISDQSTASALSGDPAVMVSWSVTGALPVPVLSSVPGAGNDTFVMDFGDFSLAAGQTGTVTIRRELFDSGALALAGGSPLGGLSLGTALDTAGMSWSSGGAASWSGQTATTHDGVDAARSGAISHGQSTFMETTVTGPGNLSFWWSVSSESGYDFLRFHLDGSEVAGAAAISGTVGWVQKTVAVGAGSHTLRWTYAKDGDTTAGSDTAWVDQVVFTPAASAPEIVVEQPAGSGLIDGGSTVACGSVAVGAVAGASTFTIRNTGSSVLTGLAVTKDGAHSAEFLIDTSGMAASLAPGASTTFSVVFTPADVGSRVAAIHVSSNDSDENPFDIGLSGTGLSSALTLAEALDGAGLVWTGSGNVAWQAQTTTTRDGVDAAQSGGIAHNQQSILQTTVTGPGTLGFAWSVSSESGYDFLRFRVNGTAVRGLSDISGTGGWRAWEVTLPAGTHTVTWTYAKDGSNNGGADAGWVDQVSFTPARPDIAIEQPAGSLILPGGSRSFGSAVVGKKITATFTVRNTGTANLQVSGATVSGANGSEFRFTGNLSAAIKPGKSKTFKVQFAPVSAGGKSALLRITSNDPDENPYDIVLAGTGLSKFTRVGEAKEGKGPATPGSSSVAVLPEIDTDSDGWQDWCEQAMGLDPLVASASPVQVKMQDGRLVMEYPRLVSAVEAGVAFTVEWSDDLKVWRTEGVSQRRLREQGGIEEIRAEVPAHGATARFLRLRLDASP